MVADSIQVISECQPDCNSWVKSWQTIENEHYDNGEFPAFLPNETVVTNYDNDLFANAPQAETLLDDYEYNEVEFKDYASEGLFNRELDLVAPTSGDKEWRYDTSTPPLDNGTISDYNYPVKSNLAFEGVDEGLYDRTPFSGISGIEFTWEAINPSAIFEPPSVERRGCKVAAE